MEALQHSDMSEGKAVFGKDFSSPCFVLGWRGDEDELVNIDSSDESRDEGETCKIIFSERTAGIASSNEVNSVSLSKTHLLNDDLCGVDEVPNVATFSGKIPAVQDLKLAEFSGSQEKSMHGTDLLNGGNIRKLPEEGFIADNLNVFAGSNSVKKTKTNSSLVSPELSLQQRLQGMEKLEKKTLDEENIDLKEAGDSERVVPAKRLKTAAQLTLHEKGVTKLGMTSERLDARKFRKAFTDKLLGMKSLKRMSIVAQAKTKIGQELLVSEKGKAREHSVDTSAPVNAVSGSFMKNLSGNKPVEGFGLEEVLKKNVQSSSNPKQGVDFFRNQPRLLDSTVKARANDIDGDSKNTSAGEKRQRNAEPLKVVPLKVVHRGKNIEKCADRQLAAQSPMKKIKVQETEIRSISLDGDQEQNQNSDLRKRSGNKGSKSHGITKQNVVSREKTGVSFDNFATVSAHKNGKAAISKKTPEECSDKGDQKESTSEVLRDSGCKHLENVAVRRILGKLAYKKQKEREKKSLSAIKDSSDPLFVEKRVNPCSRRDGRSKKRNAKKSSKSSSQLQEIVSPSERKTLGKSFSKDCKPSFGINMQAEQGEEMDHIDGGIRTSSRSSNELLVASRPLRKRRKLVHANLGSILTGEDADQSYDIQLSIGNKATNTGIRDSPVNHSADGTFPHEKVIDASNSSAENEKWKSSQWVECISCKKWRRIPFDVEITTRNWQCKDNIWEVKFASCDAPQDTMAELAHQCDSQSTSVSASRSLSVNLPNLAEVVVLENEALNADGQVGEGCVIGSTERKELVWVKIEDTKLWWPARHVSAVEWPENLEKRRLLANENVVCLFQPEGSSQYMIKKRSSLLPFGEHYDTLKDSNSTALFKAAVTKAYEIYVKDCEIVEDSSAQVIKEAGKRKDDAEELANFDDKTFAAVAAYDTDVIHHPQGLTTSESASVAAGDYFDECLPSQFLSEVFTLRNQGDPDQQVVNDNIVEHREEAVQEAQNYKAGTEVTRLDLGSANTGISLREKGTAPLEQTLEHCNVCRELLSGSKAACRHHHHEYCLSSPFTSVLPESGRCSNCIEDCKSDPEAVALDHLLEREKDLSMDNIELPCTSSKRAVIKTLNQVASYAGKVSEYDGESRSKVTYDVFSQEPDTLQDRELVLQSIEVFDMDSNQQPTIEVKGKPKDQDMGSEVDADEDAISDSQLEERDITIWSSNDAHHSFCEVCGEGGELLCCDGKTCRNTYHLGCLDPPLNEVPKGNWYCPDCSSEVHAVFGEVESIWDAQKGTLAAQPGIFGDCIDGGSLEDIYYVKWKHRAHIHNRWVSESELLKLAPKKLKIFKRKIQQGKALKWDPEWAVPHRVIGKRQSAAEIEQATRSILDCGNEWNVKWKNLGYDQCTWESTELALRSIPTMADLEKSYELRCAVARYRAELGRMQEAKKLRKGALSKLNQQPDWVVGGKLLPRQIDVLNQLRKFWKNDTNGIVIDGASQERIVTTINFVVSLIEEFRVVRPILVVGPSDTIPVWEAEIAQWAPTINAVTYSGSREAREVIRKFEIGTCVEPIKVQLLLTSFEILNADVNYLREIKWEAFLIDEGQRIRAAKTFQNLKSIEAEFCVFASSEKLKINLEDLVQVYSLVERDSSLLHVESRKSFFHEDEDVQLEDLQKKLNLYTVCDYQCETPPDIHVEYWVPVTMPQVQVHEYCKILVQNYELLQSSRMRPDHKGSFRDLLLKLRECCNHPNTVTFSIQASLAKVIPGRALLDAGIKASGKLQLLHLMLLQLKLEGRRVLIFTQTTCLRGVVSKIDILEDYLRQQFGVDAYERLDGGLAWSKKQAALQRFNARDSDRFVFLIDRRSCGFSLKLASVDTIIIYDSDWNPHTDIQALLRAHISSKSRKLRVYRLYSRNTLEERVLLGAYQTGTSDHKQKSLNSQFFQKAVRWGAETLLKLDEQDFATNSPSSNCEPQLSKTMSPFIVHNTPEGAQDEVVCFDTETVMLILSGTPQPSSRSSINYFLQKVLSPREMGADVTEKGPLLYGVTQEEWNEEEDESGQDFWNRILKEKFERWQAKEEERNPRKGQRVRKKVQYDESIENPTGEISVAPSDVLEERRRKRRKSDEPDTPTYLISPKAANEHAGERDSTQVSVTMPANRPLKGGKSPGCEVECVGLERKVLLKALNAFSEEMSQSKSNVADGEMSRTPFITESHTKPTVLGFNPEIAGEAMAVEACPQKSCEGEFEALNISLQSKLEKDQCSGEECSECAKSVHSVQKQLHMAMKPELAILCQILQFPSAMLLKTEMKLSARELLQNMQASCLLLLCIIFACPRNQGALFMRWSSPCAG
ncbi:hypothetical protein O6H91_09G064000 [Diphasiastrum complanatum]|uniref:Uncharacterized protein n=1 Tax=Diphasiastrum complanatum TaxID=34168 RepID=A0ACC2CPU4_DIPCM|nr:hypothetical protein O6H91_09G064000 [Diphasiastrum complanatum]